MTDYREEQKNEIEALESIYPTEIQIISLEPEYVFSIDIKTDPVRYSEESMTVCIKFTYVASYPDEAPLIEIENSENVSEKDAEELLRFLHSRVEENLGMVMVFTLVSDATDWLNQRMTDNMVQQKMEEEQKLLKQEEDERNRFEGKRVTVESFMSWKAKFDLEMLELKQLQSKNEPVSKKLTGRELFEKDKSLIDSDLQFLQEGEEEVKVDESLFQELDDLELQDEEISD